MSTVNSAAAPIADWYAARLPATVPVTPTASSSSIVKVSPETYPSIVARLALRVSSVFTSKTIVWIFSMVSAAPFAAPIKA